MTIVEILRILFPALMVTGALGSLITNIVTKGDWPVSLQWLGACLLYTAQLFRKMRLEPEFEASKKYLKADEESEGITFSLGSLLSKIVLAS